MRDRLTFLSHFVLCLAFAAAAFFAWERGVLQTIYAADSSMMTSVIAVLFIGTATYLGRQAWLIDNYAANHNFMTKPPTTEVGHTAQRLSVAIALVGTVLGLYLQAKENPGGVNFTALLTTGVGAAAYALITVMTHNLDASIERARR